jgi:hypothetical protein
MPCSGGLRCNGWVMRVADECTFGRWNEDAPGSHAGSPSCAATRFIARRGSVRHSHAPPESGPKGFHPSRCSSSSQGCDPPLRRPRADPPSWCSSSDPSEAFETGSADTDLRFGAARVGRIDRSSRRCGWAGGPELASGRMHLPYTRMRLAVWPTALGHAAVAGRRRG